MFLYQIAEDAGDGSVLEDVGEKSQQEDFRVLSEMRENICIQATLKNHMLSRNWMKMQIVALPNFDF